MKQIDYMNSSLIVLTGDVDRFRSRDLRKSVIEALDVRSFRDFIEFADNLDSMLILELGCDMNETPLREWKTSGESPFGENAEAVISRIEDLEYLDQFSMTDFSVTSREERTYGKVSFTDTFVHMTEWRGVIYVSSLLDLVENVQDLLYLAGVALTPESKLGTYKHGDSKIWKTKARCLASFRSEVPSRVFSNKGQLVDEKILKDLSLFDGNSYDGLALLDEERHQLFVMSGKQSDQEAAAELFCELSRSLFGDQNSDLAASGPFEVSYSKGGFYLSHKETLVESFFHEVLKIACEGKVAICPHCGRAYYRETAKQEYCRNSCKTLASKARREKAIRMAESGKPVEEAIEAVGRQYEASIRKWYKQAKEPVDNK